MENIENTKPSNEKVDIGNIIDEGFDIYKKIAVQAGLGFLLLFSVAIFIVVNVMSKFIDFDKLKDMKGFNPEMLTMEQNIMIVGGVTIFTALISPFIAGILKMAQDADRGEEVKFSTFWTYVNSDRFIHLISLTILLSFLNISIEMFLKYFISENISGIISFVFSIILNTLSFLAVPYIIFGNLDFINSLKQSYANTRKHFFVVFLALLVGQIFAILGLLAFCVGVIFSMPVLSAFQYVTYKKVG